MNSNRTYITVVIAAIVCACAIFFFTARTAHAPAVTETQITGPNVVLSVQGLLSSSTEPMTPNESVLDLLLWLNGRNALLRLSTKSYASMGTLVTSMNGMTNGTNKDYWQYKVDGVMPQVGADSYKLKSGDSIEWFFGPSQE